MEPLQEQVAEVIAQAEEEKKNMEKIQLECAQMINEEVTTQVVDTLKENTTQVQTQTKELIEKFQTLAGVVEEVHKV
jgi:hypothetical protein